MKKTSLGVAVALWSIPFALGFRGSCSTTPLVLSGNKFSNHARRIQAQQIVEGVEYDTLAREWRCKWEGGETGMASLVAAQVALESVLDDLKEVDGVKSIERIVCGECMDFKVITSMDPDTFVAWESNDFDPEVYFLEMLADIDGITSIESQTYTKLLL